MSSPFSRLAGSSRRSRLITLGWLASLALAGLGACGGDDATVAPDADTGPVYQPTLGVAADLPTTIDPTDLTVHTAADSVTVAADGSFTVTAGRNRPQLFTLNDSAGRAVHLTVFSGADGDSVIFSAEETAHALIFLHPLYMTETTENWQRARALVATRPSFAALVEAARTSITAGRLIGDEDPDLTAALAAVYAEVSNYLWENFRYWKSADKDSQTGPSGGLEVIDVTVAPDSSEATFRVRNERRRWLAVYARPHRSSGYDAPELLEILPAPRISFFASVLDGVGQLETLTEFHTVATAGCDWLGVDCYGLGLGDLSEAEWDMALDAMLCPLIFDYGLPLAEALRGRGGLRVVGDPRDDPLMGLLAMVRDRGASALRNDLARAARLQEAETLLAVTLDAVFGTILNNPEDFALALVDQAIQSNEAEAEPGFARAMVTILMDGLGVVAEAAAQSAGMRTIGSTLALPSASHFRIDLGDTTQYPYLLRGRINDATTGYPVALVDVAAYDDTGEPIAVTEASNVGYFQLRAPAGDLRLRFTRRGYRGYDHVFKIWPDDPTDYWLDQIDLVPASEDSASVEGIVTNAVTGEQVFGVTVELLPGFDREAQDVIATTLTTVRGDSAGYYRLDNLVPGNYTLRTAAPDFVPACTFVVLRPNQLEQVFQLLMSPEGTSTMRVILAWGANPSDLDSHLLVPEGAGPAFDVRWNNRGSFVSWPFADLDVDDTTSYGPETITIAQPQPGVYRYAVYHWAGSGGIPTSEARVMVYGTEGLIREWRAPSAGTGRWWYVFDLDATQERLTSVNQIQSEPPEGIQDAKANGLQVKPSLRRFMNNPG